MVAASPRECRSRAPNVCAAAEGPPFRKSGTALASTGTPPFYAADDTQLLHSAIFARFMVRKALTGTTVVPGRQRVRAKRGPMTGSANPEPRDSRFDAAHRPGMTRVEVCKPPILLHCI